MKKYLLLMLLIGELAFNPKSFSQNIAINGNGSLPDTSAMLDVSSTVKGFLTPRMTTAQQNAIPLPAKGLLIYNTTDNLFKVNIGTAAAPVWTPLSTSSNTGTVTSVGLTSSDITVGGSSPVTTSGAYTLTLPAINSNAGTFTNATITVNAKGLITAAASGVAGISSGSSGWLLTGNSSTTPNNFIGTSDAQPLTFKIAGVQAGYLGLSGTSYATSFGVGSSASFQSTAIGAGATASSNNQSVALGYNTGAAGQQTVAIGAGAIANSNNEAIAIGLSANGAGYRSIAIGSAAKAITGNNETISMGYNTSVSSYRGIAIGSGAATSANNDALAIGVGATASGYQSTAIGVASSATAQNSTAIGNGASSTIANYISIGNTTVEAIRGNVNFKTYSDGRFKRNIHADVPGLDFILHLRPVTYNWDIHKFNAHSKGKDVAVMVKYSPENEAEEAAILKKESITYTGFIAQEVERAAENCKFNFSGVARPVDDKDAYSLSYAEFVVPLVKAAQELNTKNEVLSKRIDDQQKMIDRLVVEVKRLKKKKK